MKHESVAGTPRVNQRLLSHVDATPKSNFFCLQERVSLGLPKRPISAYSYFYRDCFKAMWPNSPSTPENVHEIARSAALQWKQMDDGARRVCDRIDDCSQA